jgi:hypothetical protein
VTQQDKRNLFVHIDIHWELSAAFVAKRCRLVLWRLAEVVGMKDNNILPHIKGKLQHYLDHISNYKNLDYMDI